MAKQLPRRDFLKIIGAGAAATASGAFPTKFFVDPAYAQSASGLLCLHIFLDGGCDWFLTHEKTGDSAFMSALTTIRPTLSLTAGRPARLALGSTNYTVHGRLLDVQSMYNAGEVAVVMKAGIPTLNSGSHEEATQDFQTGVANGQSMERAGWMQRVAGKYFNNQFNLVDLRGGSPITAGGPFRGVFVNDLASFGYDGGLTTGNNIFRLDTAFAAIQQANVNAEQLALQNTYTDIDNLLTSVSQAVTGTTINPAFEDETNNNVLYSISRQLRDAFRAFVNFPTRMVHCSTGGFDLHGNSDPQNQVGNNLMGQSSLLRQLNVALAKFRANCIRVGIWNRMVIVINSEFARTNRENSNNGLDHADGGVCWLIGGAVKGGHYGDEPTAADLSSSRNGVDATTAAPDIYWEIVEKMGMDPTQIFPGHSKRSLGLLL